MATVEQETIRLATKDLRDTNPEIRSGAAKQLGKLRAASAVPELIETLQDTEWMVRLMAANALGNIGNPAAISAIPVLQELLSDQNATVVTEAKRVIELLQR